MCNYFGREIKQTISLYFDQWNCFFFLLLQMYMLAKRRKCNKANNSLFEKVGQFFYFENLIFKVCSHILIKPVWFFYIKNYFVQDWDYPSRKTDYFSQSIFMQSNSISAKIAILNLVWRNELQRRCYWIYWPYVRDIRPALRGIASLSSRRPGLQLFTARLTFLIRLLQMSKQKLNFLIDQAYKN